MIVRMVVILWQELFFYRVAWPFRQTFRRIKRQEVKVMPPSLLPDQTLRNLNNLYADCGCVTLEDLLLPDWNILYRDLRLGGLMILPVLLQSENIHKQME